MTTKQIRLLIQLMLNITRTDEYGVKRVEGLMMELFATASDSPPAAQNVAPTLGMVE